MSVSKGRNYFHGYHIIVKMIYFATRKEGHLKIE